MCQELENLAKDFAQHRGDKRRAKYPKSLWEKAIELCKQHSTIKVAQAIGVNKDYLQLHLYSRKIKNNVPQFIPVQISQTPTPVQIHIGGKIPITIDFCRSTEELVKLVAALGGEPC